jgi:Ca-activated chloride channel family protein
MTQSRGIRAALILPAVVFMTMRGELLVGAQAPAFKSGVDMVPLTVTVTDARGKYVTGLTDKDFTVLEDGVAQSLTFFAREDVPLDLALLLDTSSSMEADLPLAQAAAKGLVHRLRDCDRGALVEIKAAANIPRPLTSNRALIEQTIDGLWTSGATALYDALYITLKEFERDRRNTTGVRRQVIVLLSDGLDTHSHIAFDDVLELSRHTGVSTYAIALRSDAARIPRAERDDQTLRADYTMSAVAKESGGRTFFPKSSKELPAIYDSIATELEHQYELGYSPLRPGGDGRFRHVSVLLPPGTNAVARTRTGYSSTAAAGRHVSDQ